MKNFMLYEQRLPSYQLHYSKVSLTRYIIAELFVLPEKFGPKIWFVKSDIYAEWVSVKSKVYCV